MNNIQGYILGFVSCVFYSIITNLDDLSIRNLSPQILGVLIVCLIISFIVKLFYRKHSFGVIFGYTSVVSTIMVWVSSIIK
jgi:hypothetical protein